MKWLLTILCVTGASFAHAEVRAEIVVAKIGREGVCLLQTDKPGLIVKEAQERSPVLVRIANVMHDRDEWVYELRFIGSTPGRHDLRDYLALADGTELKILSPILVQIDETLPTDHDGSLGTLATPGRHFTIPYRRLLQGSIVLWLAATGYFAYRVWSRRRPAAKPSVIEEVKSDPLPVLIEKALNSQLDAAGQARLEMLLLARCQSSLTLGELSPQEALRRMRAHPQTSDLVHKLETWLHAPPGRDDVDVELLLAPYRSAS